MAWQRVDLVVEGARAEALSDALAEAGAIATEISDAGAGTGEEHAVFAEPGADAPSWPRSRVSALFPAGHDLSRALDRALAECGLAHLEAASLDLLRRPPGGRVTPFVWRRLVERHGRPEAELVDAIFGAPGDVLPPAESIQR